MLVRPSHDRQHRLPPYHCTAVCPGGGFVRHGCDDRHEDQILEELNVKTVELIPRDAELVSYRIKPNLPSVGKRYGRLIPAIRDFLGRADGVEIAAAVTRGESQTFVIEGSDVVFEPQDLLVETESAEGFACAEEVGYLVGLDTALNDELRREGLARELVRAVQDARKQAGLEVSDRIVLLIEGDQAVDDALNAHRDYLMSETLASRWQMPPPESAFIVEQEQEDRRWIIRLAKDESAGDRDA